MLLEDLRNFIAEDPSRIEYLDIETVGTTNDGVNICNVSIFAFDKENAIAKSWVGVFIRQDELDDVLKPFL